MFLKSSNQGDKSTQIKTAFRMGISNKIENNIYSFGGPSDDHGYKLHIIYPDPVAVSFRRLIILDNIIINITEIGNQAQYYPILFKTAEN